MCGRCISVMRIRQCVLPMAKERLRKAHWLPHWASILSGLVTIISTLVLFGVKTLPKRHLSIIRTNAGSNLALRMRYLLTFWMSTACKFMILMASFVARIWLIPTPAMSSAVFARCRISAAQMAKRYIFRLTWSKTYLSTMA